MVSKNKTLVAAEQIAKLILLIRGHKVILDRDLTELCDVATRDLNKALSRNIDRFPADFMIKITKEEFLNLKSHFGTSSWGGIKYRKYWRRAS